MTPALILVTLVAAVAVAVALRATRRLAAADERAERLVTELKRVSAEADSAVEASRDRFEDLARVAPVGFFEANDRGEVVYVSERFASLLGCSRAAARGSGWLEAVHEQDRERLRAGIRGAVERRQRFASSIRAVPADAATEWLLVQAVPLVEPTGAVGRVVGTLADVTDQRRLEDRAREAQRMESLAMLAGGVAHDFNDLLVDVLARVAGLKARLAEGSHEREEVEAIEITALRGADLAKKMLSFAGKGVVTVASVDVHRLVDELRRLLGTRVPDLRVEPSEQDLPPIEADLAQVRQVLLGLIGNASEAYGGASGPVTVRFGRRDVWTPGPSGAAEVLAPSSDGPFVAIDVEDRGRGMDGATLAAAFDPFFTTRTSSRGLGLAVVLGAVRRHGGGLSVRTAPGEGTLVSVWFPCVATPIRSGPSAAARG